jgi:hypothetical protein
MENTQVLKRRSTSSEKQVKKAKMKAGNSGNMVNQNMPVDKSVTEVDDNFNDYLSWNGLSKNDDLLVLPSTLHYYYDYEELKSVRTLINLRKLNQVKNLGDFLQTLYRGLSPETNFIGCFADSKSEKISTPVRYYKKFLDFIDARFNAEMDCRHFSKLLESHGFKIMDMTEINGLTYFRSQNLGRTA